MNARRRWFWLRLTLAGVAVVTALLWLADIEWVLFWDGAGADFGDFVWLAGGAVAGACAGFATGGRRVPLLTTLGCIVAVTVAAFIAMPWDVEAEGGAPLIMFWAFQAVIAALCATAIAYLVIRPQRPGLR